MLLSICLPSLCYLFVWFLSITLFSFLFKLVCGGFYWQANHIAFEKLKNSNTYFKINFDDSVLANGRSATGFVIRNHYAHPL